MIMAVIYIDLLWLLDIVISAHNLWPLTASVAVVMVLKP